ncbi:hypothetical protein [Paracoccus sediminis]|nr:hypothetical protein [Paracoccus sediminis]SNR75368.1 hypothetical protein SAMN06265378_1327 [Paracoccus sediminis]
MRGLLWGLCLVSLVLGLAFGFVLFAALADGSHVCPDSDQCIDAINAATNSGVIVMICLGVALISLWRLKITSTRKAKD